MSSDRDKPEVKQEHQGIASILGILEGCKMPEVITSSEQYGASYKQLAYVAHRAGLSQEERQTWYKVAASIPLSQGHAGFLISRLDQINELEHLYSMEPK